MEAMKYLTRLIEKSYKEVLELEKIRANPIHLEKFFNLIQRACIANIVSRCPFKVLRVRVKLLKAFSKKLFNTYEKFFKMKKRIDKENQC